MSEISFPIVGSGQAALGKVSCACLSPEHYPPGRALVIGRDEREIERILADARHDEPSGAEIAKPIRVRMQPSQFSGESFGLALAIADKRARYERDLNDQAPRIFASGVVSADGAGRIGAVAGVEEKLDVILDAAAEGDAVVLPKANVDGGGVRVADLLDRLRRRGVIYLLVEHVDDSKALWLGPWPPPETPELSDLDAGNEKKPDDDDPPPVGPIISRRWRAPLLVFALVVVMATSALWPVTRSPTNDLRASGDESALTAIARTCDPETHRKREAEARARLFDRPRTEPLQVLPSPASERAEEAVRAAEAVLRERLFTLTAADDCPGWRLDIGVDREGSNLVIAMTLRWAASGEAIFDRRWTDRVADNADDAALQASVETLVNAVLRRLFIQRTVGSIFREEQNHG